jgi:hypothetical protein
MFKSQSQGAFSIPTYNSSITSYHYHLYYHPKLDGSSNIINESLYYAISPNINDIFYDINLGKSEYKDDWANYTIINTNYSSYAQVSDTFMPLWNSYGFKFFLY